MEVIVIDSNKHTSTVLQAEKDSYTIWRQLTLSIYHSPHNLKLHTQRILFCMDNGLAEHIAGALHDLFVILQDKGLGLRQRMFNLASPVMSSSDRTYFQVWLSKGSDKSLECCRFSGSVLKSKTCQNQDGETKNSFRGIPEFNSILEEAEYAIESGQLQYAQILLEKSCLKKLDDITMQSAMQKELQRFYFYTKNKSALDAFMIQLKDSGVKFAKTWVDLQEMSKAW